MLRKMDFDYFLRNYLNIIRGKSVTFLKIMPRKTSLDLFVINYLNIIKMNQSLFWKSLDMT